jgi:phosphoglucomutase
MAPAELATRIDLPKRAIALAPAGGRVAWADDFAYTDPVDRSASSDQGLRVGFDGGTGIVLRLYFERYEPDGAWHGIETQQALVPLIASSEQRAGIVATSARTLPTVIT